MRSYLPSWNRTLAKLGITRKHRKNCDSYREFRRRPLFENLEPRQLLTGVTFTVNVDTDQNDGAANGTSLRDALAAALANNASQLPSDVDTIQFDSSVFAGPKTITLNQAYGDLDINSNVTIVGTCVDNLTITGNGLIRVFNVSSGVNGTISNLTITKGNAGGGNGGGIYSAGNLTLQSVAVVDNDAALGGGIYQTGGTLSIESSAIEKNEASANGGGLYASSVTGTAQIKQSTFAENKAMTNGGGLYLQGSNINIENTTISTNQLTQGEAASGAGVFIGTGVSKTIQFTNSTLTLNKGGKGSFSGGGIANQVVEKIATVILKNTIVVGNTSLSGVANDLTGPYDTSSSYNLIGVVGQGTFPSGNNNQLGVSTSQAALAPLGNYGGPTRTHALLSNSKAINAGDDSAASLLIYDQRGLGFKRLIGPSVDIGAFEYSESIYIDDVIVLESDESNQNNIARVYFSSSGPQTVDAFFDYETIDGTAVSATDYQSTANQGVILAGQTQTYVDITITNDTLIEGEESFFIRIIPNSNLMFRPTERYGEIRIKDNLSWIKSGDVTVAANNNITVGMPDQPEDGSQPVNYHGVSIPLAIPANSGPYTVDLSWNLSTWDSYSPGGGDEQRLLGFFLRKCYAKTLCGMDKQSCERRSTHG